MASKKRQSEGIALLSMYNDEDEEMDDTDEEEIEEHWPKGVTEADDSEDKEKFTPPSFNDGVSQEENPVDIVSMTTSNIESPQASEQLDITAFDQVKAPEVVTSVSGTVGDVTTVNDMDLLETFLPPSPKAKCRAELQEKINKFLSYKRTGKSFNAEVRNKKDYRNPDFLLHAVTYQGIDQIGSCFSKEVFDPHGYDKSDFYDEIEADMRREIERKEQEKKHSQKVDFVSGGVQSGNTNATPKISFPISGPASATSDVPRAGRHNKKSKWDKVDDVRGTHLPTSSSHDHVGVNAAQQSAVIAGAGYTAFAQQKRKEAEEKKAAKT